MNARFARRARAGFTLPEILIVIVMISVLALVAIPRFADANARRHLESARLRVAAALVTARQAAIQKGRSVEFELASNRVTVRAQTDATELISPVPLDTLYNVRATSGDLTVVFDGRGMSQNGSVRRVVLARTGAGVDTVVISKTGMVQP